jgi:hypothetical protein
VIDSIFGFCHYLQSTELATAFRQSDVAFPLVEGTHILALSLSVGLILLFDLRLLRIAFRSQPVSRIMHEVMPWALPGFAIMFITGLILFFAQAEKVAKNSYFQVKFAVLILLGINALFYQVKFYPRMAEWDTSDAIPAGARACGMISLLFWMIVIACGRIMAYEL